MPYLANRNIVMICKEAMNNSARNSGATMVRLGFELSAQGLSIEWFDNGVSDLAAMEESRRGVQNMKERAARMGGSLRILNEQGTTLHLFVPLRTTPGG